MAFQLCHRSTRVCQGRLRLDSPDAAHKSSRTFKLESRSFSTQHHQFKGANLRSRITRSNVNDTRRTYCTASEEQPKEAPPTEPKETKSEMPASPTMQQLVENPEWLATLPMLSEEQKKIVRHRVDKNGEIILPPWRMVTTNLRRRKTVVIAGVRGTLGASLKVALEERGHEVIGISRRSGESWPYNKESTLQWWEVLGHQGIPDCDALVQLTGAPYLGLHTVPNKDFEQELYNSRGALTELMAQQMERTVWKPKVFVQASDAFIYPSSQTAVYDESYSGPFSSDLVGSVNSHYEERSKLFEKYGTRTVQMRLGQVVADIGFLEQHYRIDRKGRAYWSRVGSGEQWMPWIHITDVIHMFIHAIEQESVQGPLNAVAPEAIRQQQLADELKRHLPFSSITIPMPETVAHWRMPKRSHLILEGRKVVPKVAQDTHFQFEYPTIAKAISSIKEDLVPIQWKNPVNTFFDPSKPRGNPNL